MSRWKRADEQVLSIRPARDRGLVLMVIGLFFVMGTGAIFGMMITLPAAGVVSNNLPFFSSGLGTIAAAMIALSAVEFDVRRKQRIARRIVARILTDAAVSFEFYGKWIDSGAPQDAAAATARNLAVFAERIREAIEIAKELRASVEGMAEARLSLGYAMADLRLIESIASTSPVSTDRLGGTATRDAVGRVVTAAIVTRDRLS